MPEWGEPEPINVGPPVASLGQQLQIERRVNELTSRYPVLGQDPNMVLALAQDLRYDDDQMNQMALVMEGEQGINMRIAALNEESESRQRAMFNQMTPELQEALRGAGYEPPRDKGWGPRINLPKVLGVDLPELGLSNAGGAIGRVLSAPTIIPAALGDAAGVALEFMQEMTLERPISLMQAQGEAAGLPTFLQNTPIVGSIAFGGSLLAQTFTEGPFAARERALEVWADSWDPHRSWTHRSKEEAREAAGSTENFLLAQELAAGRKISDVLMDRGMQMTDPEWSDAYLELYELSKSPQVLNATVELAEGRRHFGGWLIRDIPASVLPDQAVESIDDFYLSKPGMLMAAGADLAIEWYADPFIVMGRMRQLTRANSVLRVRTTQGAVDLHRARLASIYHQIRTEGVESLSKHSGDFLDSLGIGATDKSIERYLGAENSFARFNLHNQGAALNRVADLVVRHFNPSSADDYVDLVDLHNAHISAVGWWPNAKRWHETEQMRHGLNKLTQPAYARGLAEGRALNGFVTRDDWWRYLSDKEYGAKMLTGSSLGGISMQGAFVPHMSRVHQLSYRGRTAWFNKALDWQAPLTSESRQALIAHAIETKQLNPRDGVAAMSPENLQVVDGFNENLLAQAQDWIDRGEWDELDRFIVDVDPDSMDALRRLTVGVKDRLSSFMLGFSTKVPKHGLLFMDNTGNQTQSVIETIGMANLTRMPREMRVAYMERLLNGTPAEQAATVQTFLGQMMLELGIIDDATGEGMELWKKYVQHSEMQWGRNAQQSFSGRDVTMAVMGSETSRVLALPDFRELAKLASQQHKLRLFGSRPYQLSDRIMGRVWKPVQLMRPGFILRAGGEELTTFLLSVGPGDYAAAKWAMPRHIDDWSDGGVRMFRSRGWHRDLHENGYDFYRHRGVQTLDQSREFLAAKPLHWLNYSLRRKFNVTRGDMYHRAMRQLEIEDLDAFKALRGGLTDDAAVEAWRRVDDFVLRETQQLDGFKGGLLEWDRIVDNFSASVARHFHTIGGTLSQPLDVRLANKIALRQARAHATGKSAAEVESMLNHYRTASMMIHSQAAGMRAFAQAAGNLYDPTKGMGVGAESFEGDPIHSMRQLGVRQYGNEYVMMDFSTDPEGYRWGLEAIIRRDASDPLVQAALAHLDGWMDDPTAQRLHDLLTNRRPGVRFGDTPTETMINMRRVYANETSEVQAAFRAFIADPTDVDAIASIRKNTRNERTHQLVDLFEDVDVSDRTSMDMLAAITTNTPMAYTLSSDATLPELVQQLARVIEREAWRPENFESRRMISLMNRHKGGQLVASVPNNVGQYLYMPTIPVEAQKHVAYLMRDQAWRTRFAEILESSFAGRQPGTIRLSDLEEMLPGTLSGANISVDASRVPDLSPETIEILDYFHPSTWTMDDLALREVDNLDMTGLADDVLPTRGSFTDVHQMAAGRVAAMRTDGLTAPLGAFAATNPNVAQQVTWAMRQVLEESGYKMTGGWPNATFGRIAVPSDDLAEGIEGMIRRRNPQAGIYQVNPAFQGNVVPMPESKARPLYHIRNKATGEDRVSTMAELSKLEDEAPGSWEMLTNPDTPIWSTEMTEMESVRSAAETMARELIDRYTTATARVQELRPLREIITPMLDNTFDGAMLDDLIQDARVLPQQVWGPKMVEASELAWDKLVRWWFDGPVSSAIDSMIREPMFVDTFAKALRDNDWYRIHKAEQARKITERMHDDEVFRDRPELTERVVGMVDDFTDAGHLDRVISGTMTPEDVHRHGHSISYRVNQALIDNDYDGFTKALLDMQTHGMTRQWDDLFVQHFWRRARAAMDEGADTYRVWTLDEVKAFLPSKFHGTRATVVDEADDLRVMRENVLWDEDLARIPEDLALPSDVDVIEEWQGWNASPLDVTTVDTQTIKALDVRDVQPVGPNTELFSFYNTDMVILVARADDSDEIVGTAMWFADNSQRYGQFAFRGNYNIADTKLVSGMRKVLGPDHPVTRQLRGVIGVDVLPTAPFKIKRARFADDTAGASWNLSKSSAAEYLTPQMISDGIDDSKKLANEIREHNYRALKTGEPLIGGDLRLTRKHFDMLRTYQRQRAKANEMHFQATLERTLQQFSQYIDDHRIRSQFQQYVNPLIPFWFAEEQFLMRMGRRIYDSPEMIRRAQLLMNFGRSSNIIQKDEFGNEVVVVPGSQLATQAIGAVAEYVSGSVARVPVVGDAVEGVTSWVPFLPPLNDSTLGLSNLGDMARPLTFQTDYALPGYNMEQTGQFQYGPLVQLAANQLSYRYPELARGADRWLGDERAIPYRNPLDVLMPSVPARLLRAAHGNTSDALFSRAMTDSILQLEAAGLGLDPNASPAQAETYLDNVRNVTRINQIFLTAFSSGAPASLRPDSLFGDLREEFMELLEDSGLQYTEAVTAFIEQNTDEDGNLDPAALAASVFKTKSTGASVSPTAPAFDWMAKNDQLLRDMPLAATWFIPQSDGEFDPRAWNQALYTGLREYKAPEEILKNIAFAEAAPNYFASYDNYMKAKLELQNKPNLDPTFRAQQLSALEEQWSVWRDSYKNLHPVFAEELARPDARIERERQLEELMLLVEDPPDSPMTDVIVTMTRSWAAYKEMADALRAVGSGAARTELDAITRQFDLWARNYIGLHPEGEPFYSRLIRPEIGASELELIYELEGAGTI